MSDTEVDYLENKQLEPEINIAFDPNLVVRRRDQQLKEMGKVFLGK